MCLLNNIIISLKAEQEVNQQQGEFKCYMIWQIMVAMLHSVGQLRKDTDTEEGCQKPAVQQKTSYYSNLFREC